MKKYKFPLTQRIMPSKIALDLIKVQPMSLPPGVLFYYNYAMPISTETINILLGAKNVG